MPYQAVHRFARISARKVRPMADIVRGKFADEALDLLRYQPDRGARMLEKVIRSAMSNAEDRRAAHPDRLYVQEVCVDGGPMIKRMQPRSRGMAMLILKRFSHIRVVLEEKA
jgi:large subunit ribosomal protein L22